MIRVGCGFDIHAFAPGRALVLGGENIPHEAGLAGHSDADALAHALCDAMLGAVGMGDIGAMFPDSDPAFRGARGADLLSRAREVVFEKTGATVVNADATVAMQRPKLAAYVPAMRANLAAALGVPASRVSVKATTGESLGFVGREEGVAVFAVVLMEVPDDNEQAKANNESRK